jgi:hypothetical protein
MGIWTQRQLTTFGIIDRMSVENPLEMAVITCWNCIKNLLLLLLQVHIMYVYMF